MNAPQGVRWEQVSEVADRVRVKLHTMAQENPDDHELQMLDARFLSICSQIAQRALRESLDDIDRALHGPKGR